MWQIGDRVRLTAAGILQLAKDCPELFTQLVQSGRTIGDVQQCTDAAITIKFGEAVSTLALDRKAPQRLIELIYREPPATQEPARTSGQSADLMICPDCGEVHAPAEDSPSGLSLDALRSAMQAAQATTPPPQIGTAQWCVSQFLELRKFQLAKQFQAGAVDGEDWKQRETVPPPLLREEQKLYAAAMRRLRDWIGSPAPPVPPVQPLQSLLAEFAGPEIDEDDFDEDDFDDADAL